MYWYKPNNQWKLYKGQSLKGQRGGLMSRWSACRSARSWAQPHSTYLKSHVRPCTPTFNPNEGGLQGPAAYQSSSSFSKLSFLKRIRQRIEQSTRHSPWASVSMYAHIHTKDGDVEVIVLIPILCFPIFSPLLSSPDRSCYVIQAGFQLTICLTASQMLELQVSTTLSNKQLL